ncbi:hypothetical protein RB195_020021 [Necator americanus]|uniref:Mos1 transposase HTH domain-containing protein n=1 Tax=Necator americanus TaxID=51031 RepID=A0ABR1CJ90_NECAM
MSNRNFRQIYFYEFKLGRTAAQTARNINEVWGRGSINECTVQCWFQKFRAGNISLEGEHLEDDLLKAIVEANHMEQPSPKAHTPKPKPPILDYGYGLVVCSGYGPLYLSEPG